jgi:predicted kinase
MIVVVFGLPGTGKSFFSKHFAEEAGARHLNTDIIREKLDLKGRYDKKAKQLVYKELHKRTRKEVQNGSDVIVDGTFHKYQRRKEITEMANEKNVQIHFIEVKATDETVKERLEKNRKHSEADFEVYEKIKRSFEPVEEDHLELWSDTNDVKEMIRKAKNYIYG